MENQLITFTPEVTPEALKLIQEQTAELPAVIETKKEYDQVYSAYQNIRKIRIAVDKRKSELQKFEKVKFEKIKKKISLVATSIYDILSPIELKLLASRTDWENKIEEKRIIKSEAAAELQRLEFERQDLIRQHTRALEDNENFNEMRKIVIETRKLAIESDKLKKEREQFEIEKNRLSFDDALVEAYPPPLIEDQTKLTPYLEEILIATEEEVEEKYGAVHKGGIIIKKGCSVPATTSAENEIATYIIGSYEHLVGSSKTYRDKLVSHLVRGFDNPKTTTQTATLKDAVINYISYLEDQISSQSGE